MNKRLDKETIEKLYIEYGTPGFVKRHCLGVTNCALKVAKALNEHGFNLDLDMIYGAGMTHDMGRAFDRHWDVAADKLEEMGYPDEAKIVRVHMEPGEYSPIEKVHEGDMLNIGDRLVMDGTYVGIDVRFDYIIAKAEKLGQMNSGRIKRVMANKEKMQLFLNEVEKVIGCSIDDLFPEEVKLREEKKVRPSNSIVTITKTSAASDCKASIVSDIKAAVISVQENTDYLAILVNENDFMIIDLSSEEAAKKSDSENVWRQIYNMHGDDAKAQKDIENDIKNAEMNDIENSVINSIESEKKNDAETPVVEIKHHNIDMTKLMTEEKDIATINFFPETGKKAAELMPDDALRFGGPGGPIMEVVERRENSIRLRVAIGGKIKNGDLIEII